MNSNIDKNGSDFKSPDDAFEYLINKRLDEKRKIEWAKELGPGPDKISKRNIKVNTSKSIYVRMASIAAASIVILFGAYWMMNDSNNRDNLMAQNYINETKVNLNYDNNSRALENNEVFNELAINVKAKLSEALLNEDFNQMLGIYRTIEKNAELPIKDKYYFAICLLKVENEDKYKAIRLLSEVIKNDHNLEVEALYFRGLAKIETGNTIEAESDLKTILTKSNYKRKTINEILKHIE